MSTRQEMRQISGVRRQPLCVQESEGDDWPQGRRREEAVEVQPSSAGPSWTTSFGLLDS